MPRVRYTGGSRYRIRDGPDFTAGDEADVDDGTAERLTARDDFELVDEDDGEETVRPADTPPFDPGALTVAEIEDRLADTEYGQAELLALYSAEAEGDERTTALDAIEQAEEELEG
jgi:hypothetical protein